MMEYIIMDRYTQHSFNADNDGKAIEKALLFAHDLGYDDGWTLINKNGYIIYDSFQAYLDQHRP